MDAISRFGPIHSNSFVFDFNIVIDWLQCIRCLVYAEIPQNLFEILHTLSHLDVQIGGNFFLPRAWHRRSTRTPQKIVGRPAAGVERRWRLGRDNVPGGGKRRISAPQGTAECRRVSIVLSGQIVFRSPCRHASVWNSPPNPKFAPKGRRKASPKILFIFSTRCLWRNARFSTCQSKSARMIPPSLQDGNALSG